MKKITFPLKSGMKRVAVGSLHEALHLLGLRVADSEKRSRLFDPGLFFENQADR